MSEKYKKLLANTAVFFVSEFASKILVFLLLPLYTNALSTSEYGISDLITTTVSLLMPVFTLSMNQAVLRFAMRHEFSKKQVISFASRIVLYGTVVMLLFYPLFVNVIGISKEYLMLFYILYFTSSYDALFSYFARGIDQIFYVGASGILKTAMTIVANIVMLIVFKWGVKGFILSTVLAHTVSILYLMISCKIYSYFSVGKTDSELASRMIKYSIPLIPNSLSWWLSNYASRYIILFYLGASVQGMYSAASKIPAVLTMAQSIFINAWQLSAISEYSAPDRDEFFTSIYRSYDFIMVVGASTIMIATKFLATIMFSASYYEAWRAVPFLLISVVFGALSGHVGTVFAANMKNKMMFTSTLIGGAVAVVGCLILIPSLGPVGAALSTAIANIIIWLIRYVRARKYVRIKIDVIRTMSTYTLLFVQAFSYIYLDSMPGYFISTLMFVMIILTNYQLLRAVFLKFEEFTAKFIKR